MTHDELLAKITNKLKYIRDQIELTENVPLYLEGEMDRLLMERAALLALRAVVELHKPYLLLPEPKIYPNWITCKGCAKWQDDWTDYPCPTIQAIEKELK